MVHARIRLRPILYKYRIMKTTYKATQQDINMPVDKKLINRILKYYFYSLGIGTFCLIMLINFIMS